MVFCCYMSQNNLVDNLNDYCTPCWKPVQLMSSRNIFVAGHQHKGDGLRQKSKVFIINGGSEWLWKAWRRLNEGSARQLLGVFCILMQHQVETSYSSHCRSDETTIDWQSISLRSSCKSFDNERIQLFRWNPTAGPVKAAE